MGLSVSEFEQDHPDSSPGSDLARAGLAGQLRIADTLAAEQQDGIRAVRAATKQKRELRRMMNDSHLVHVARAGQAAADELPELAQVFAFSKEQAPYAAFRTRAHSIVAAAEDHMELLVKYGLSDTTFQGLKEALSEFDGAVERGIRGRAKHIAASAEQEVVADRIVRIVRVMDGRNRFRFRTQPGMLAAWKAASRVRPDRPGEAEVPDEETKVA